MVPSGLRPLELMNSAFVLCVYFATVLSPCIVAQCGDLLNLRWMLALARRRRTHRDESFFTSFQHERSVLAAALEAHVASFASETFALPKPFLIAKPKPVVAVGTPAFLKTRQRIATRVAQLAVAQKLRTENADASQEIVAVRAEAPAETLADVTVQQPAAAALQDAGAHLHRPHDTAVHMAARGSVSQTAYAVAAYVSSAPSVRRSIFAASRRERGVGRRLAFRLRAAATAAVARSLAVRLK